MLKKQERVIPKKNYIYLLIMLVFVVVLTFWIFDLNKKHQLQKLEVSYLSGYITEIKLEDLSNILTEPSSELFILVTKTNDENVYKLENDLKKIIKTNDIRDYFLFIDYTDKDLSVLNRKIGSNIKSLPALIYFKNGEYIKSIDSSLDMLSSDDLEQLIDEYEVN